MADKHSVIRLEGRFSDTFQVKTPAQAEVSFFFISFLTDLSRASAYSYILQVSGEVDQIFQDMSRDEAISEARRIAEQRAVNAGADAAGRGPAPGLPAGQFPAGAGGRRHRLREA